MFKRSIKISLIKFLTLLIVAIPFVFIRPLKAEASTYDDTKTVTWITPMPGSPLQISNLQVASNNNDSAVGGFPNVKLSWQTSPSSPGAIGYHVTVYTSDDQGATWNAEAVSWNSDPSTHAPHLATVSGCYSAVAKWGWDRFEPVPEATFTSMFNGSCNASLFAPHRPTLDYSIIDTGNTVYYRHFKYNQTSLLVKNNFILQFKIETYYDAGVWSLSAPGPVINFQLTAGAQISENQRINWIQQYYNNVLSSSLDMFGPGKIVKGANWTDSRSIAEWVRVQLADAATATVKEVMLASGAPQGIVNALISDTENLFPTDPAGWNVVGAIKIQSANILAELRYLKTLKGSNDVLSKEFIIKDVTTGAEKKRTTSLQEVETELKAQLDAIASTVGSNTDPGGTAGGLCMGKEGLNIGGGDINIISFMACLINEVATGILNLAIEWMQIFAGI